MQYTVKKLPVRVNNNWVVSNTWTSKKGFSADKIKDKFNEMIKELVENGHEGEIALKVMFDSSDGGPGKWRYLTQYNEIKEGLHFEINEKLADYWGKYPGILVSDKFHAFTINITKKNKPEGGNDPFNDCFYNCLNQLIPKLLQKVFPNPEDLKEYCGLERNSLFPLEKIPLIEEALPKCSINVSGEYMYNSTKKAIHTINLRLWNDHYSINKEKGKINQAVGIALEEKIPVIYKFLPNEPEHVEIYNGEKTIKVSFAKFKHWKSNPRSSRYMLLKFDGTNVKKQYNKFIADAEILKEKTNGRFNLYKTGTVNKAALNRFYELNKSIIADPIEHDEAEWLSGCSMSSLIWVQKGYKGEGWCYDVNSAYSNILANQNFAFPVKRGEFKKITQEEFDNKKYLEFGIYHVKILDADYRLLPTSKEMYIHFDLARAKELGYKIKVIEDGQPNVLSYAGPTTRISGTAFKDYVDELYTLKKELGKEYPIFKKQINVLWGMLCKKNKRKTFINNNQVCDVQSNEKLLEINSIGDKYTIVKTAKLENQFESGFARLGPFLLSRCRCMLSRIIEPHLNNVVRMHTDGFISSKQLTFKKEGRKIDSVKIGNDLGDLKLEEYCPQIFIHNANLIDGYKEKQKEARRKNRNAN